MESTHYQKSLSTVTFPVIKRIEVSKFFLDISFERCMIYSSCRELMCIFNILFEAESLTEEMLTKSTACQIYIPYSPNYVDKLTTAISCSGWNILPLDYSRMLL